MTVAGSSSAVAAGGLGGPGGIDVRRQGAALVLQLARPQRANAYTLAMLTALEEHIERADADPDVRVIVITGAGDRSFCAGADRDELAARDWRSVLTLCSARAFRRIQQSRCVTIAAINGAAVGGGMELALSCDLRVAADNARFWLPEPEFGLLPAAGATNLLPRLVGPLKAKELILGGAAWDAAEALHIGFLSEVTPAASLFDRIQLWIDRIVRRDADALRLAKHAIDLGSRGLVDTGFELAAQSLLVRNQSR